MRIDLYHLYRGFHFSKFSYPIVLDVLRVWAETCGWEARVSICKESQVNLSTDADVVGFSVYTQTAPAVYRVSEQLRRRGKIVLLGGPHFRGPSTLEEAAPYCDVIASSIYDDQMRSLLADIGEGRLRRQRENPILIIDRDSRFRYPTDFYQALRSRRWYQIPTLPTSLGCPYDCTFCAAYMQGAYHLREIETIYNEMAYAPGRVVLICDATFGLSRSHTIKLMHAVASLKKKLAVETTLARLKDPKVLEALALGGVKWMIVGIETLALKLQKHGSVDLEAGLREVIDRAHDLGMMIQGNFICGLDSDGPESFDHIYEYYDRSNLDAIMIGILTPYPDTSLYRQLASEGRIFDTNWEHYDCHHVVYRPRRMSVDQLIDGYIQLYQNIRRRKSVLRETFEGIRNNGVRAESLVMIGNNLYQKFDSVKKTRLLRKNQREIAEVEFESNADAVGAFPAS